MTLGLTSGDQNWGLTCNSGTMAFYKTGPYGQPVGNITNTGSDAANKNMGITLDSTKSGIESDVSNNINYIIKY